MVTTAAASSSAPTSGSSGQSSSDVEATTLEAYHAARSSLIATERALRHDAAKQSSLTPLEQQADSILTSLRTAYHADLDADPTLSSYPGMPLRQSLARGARRTPLWLILSRMPKGGALHCHMDGTVPATWLIDEAVARYGDVIHMRADRALDGLKMWDSGVQFKPLHEEDVMRGNVYEAKYDGKTQWMSLKEARDSFPFEDVYEQEPMGYQRGVDLPSAAPATSTSSNPRTRNQAAFDSYLHSLMTLTPTPSHSAPPTTTSRQAWSRFLSTFSIIGGFISYGPLLHSYIKQMVKVHARDGCQYLEARLNFFEEHYVGKDARTLLGHAEWCEIFEAAVLEARRELEVHEGIETFLDARIIYCTVRIVDNERLRWYLEDCLELKRRFGRLIVGFDLVGHEDPGVTLKDYAPELLRFQQLCTSSSSTHIPFLFHAGETLLSSSPADSNLYDALLLSTRRIGHGYTLARHPHLMKLCRERGVCVEVCPISNEALGYTGSMANHPLEALLGHGVQVVLSSDDATQFGNFGLTHDLYQYFTSTQSAGLASLYTLIHASLRHASLDDPVDVEKGERQRHLDLFEGEWQRWVRWVVEEYGGEEAEQEGEERVKKAAKMDGHGEVSSNGGEASSKFFWQY